MNGKIMLNGKAYSSSGRPSREITMAQWLALPDTKYTDGVVYYIKDIGGANQFPPLIYSDDEREIGVWRDGRPLYQRTFVKTLGANAYVNLDTNIDSFFIVGNTYIGPNDSISEQYIDQNIRVYCFVQVYLDNGVRTMRIQNMYNQELTYVVTVRYTKTTDTPGSGTWTTDGTYAHHYSTSEKVIGTWIDGKPLYEKVVEKTCSFTTQSDVSGVIYGSDVSLATEIPNIDMAWFMKDRSYYIVDNSTRGFYNGWYENNSATFYIQTLYSRSNVACKFVIQYTKTTD